MCRSKDNDDNDDAGGKIIKRLMVNDESYMNEVVIEWKGNDGRR